MSEDFEYAGDIPQNRYIAITTLMRGVGVSEHRMCRDHTTGAYSVRVRPIHVDITRSLITLLLAKT